MKGSIASAGICLVLLLCLFAPAAAFTPGGYIIEPAYGATGTPAADLVPITFWDLTLREMAIVAVLSCCPFLVFPVELFFAVKILAILGFRKITGKNALDNATRERVYRIVISKPGIRSGELMEQAGISRGALNYHLEILKCLGKITVLKTRGTISYFGNSGTFDLAGQKVCNALNHERERKILKELLRHPERSRAGLAAVLNVSGPTVTWHINRLCADGILLVKKEGRHCRYVLTGESAGSIRKFLGAAPAGTIPHEVPMAVS